MTQTTDHHLTVYTILNNYPGKRPRLPLVQMIAVRSYRHDAISISPAEAIKLSRLLARSAKAAKAGRRLVEFDLPLENFYDR